MHICGTLAPSHLDLYAVLGHVKVDTVTLCQCKTETPLHVNETLFFFSQTNSEIPQEA